MSKQVSVNTTVCNEYLRLLEESQRALEIWNEQHAEACQCRLSGKEAGDELLRLQAKYDRAYTVLQTMPHNCSLFQFVARIGGHDPEISWEAFSDNKLYT